MGVHPKKYRQAVFFTFPHLFFSMEMAREVSPVSNITALLPAEN